MGVPRRLVIVAPHSEIHPLEKDIPMTTTTRVLALAAGLLLAASAQAQNQASSIPSGFVLGAAGGLSKYNDSCEGVSRCDTTGRALRFNAGYGLGNGLVIEAVSFDFGKMTGSAGGIDIEIKASAFGGGAAYYAPLRPDMALFVRLGVAQVKTKVRGSVPFGSFSDSDDHTTLYGGIGFAWSLSRNAALEVAWESSQMKYGNEKEAVGAGTVGLSFRF